jgi:hypothetical protein
LIARFSASVFGSNSAISPIRGPWSNTTRLLLPATPFAPISGPNTFVIRSRQRSVTLSPSRQNVSTSSALHAGLRAGSLRTSFPRLPVPIS